MAAQMPTLTTSAADSVQPPWPSCCAHLHLVPGSSATLAPGSRSRAAVMWPQLLWLRAKTNAVVLSLWSSYLKNKIKSTNLPYSVCLTVPSTASAFTLFFAREGPVRLPRHFQYIDRSSSLNRSLSLLCSPCSLLLLHGFHRCCTERACKPSTQTISCFWVPGE